MEPEKDLDTITKHLQISGWSFGWSLIDEDGENAWQVDAVKGRVNLVAKHKNLTLALNQIKQKIHSLN